METALSLEGIFFTCAFFFIAILAIDKLEPHRAIRENRELKSKAKEADRMLSINNNKVSRLESQIKTMKPIYDKHKPKSKPTNRASKKPTVLFKISKFKLIKDV